MDLLQSPVSALSGVGPKYQKLLENLEIFKVEDLVYHIPFRYDDYSVVKKISELQEGEAATVTVVMGTAVNIFTKNGKRLTKATASDNTGKISLIWFNQHYIKNSIKVGATYNVSGKITLFDRGMTIISPELEEEDGNRLNTGRLVPIYFETAGVSSKWIRIRINDVLNRLNAGTLPEFTDLVPAEIKQQYKLKDLVWAVNKVHFPNEISEIDDAKKRLAFDEVFYDLLNVQSRKQEWKSQKKSYIFKHFAAEVADLVKSLPFELTQSQQQAVSDIVSDTQNSHPMNRLLEGDVGTGKTIVALIGAYLAFLNGYKTIYLAPTEILAQQHYKTFVKFLKNTDVKVALLTQTQKTLDKGADVIIGTHALLFDPEIFKKVGFVVIDEQHRFGVEQRGRLLALAEGKNTPHLLTMTATPIPRTLALTIYGDLSLSTLKTNPKTIRKVATKIVPESGRQKVYDWIKKSNLPTFIVCPFIEESDVENLAEVKAAQKEYTDLKKGVFSDIKMGLIHGKMKSEEKQKVIDDFRLGKIKVLVSTPVIEVGIDIPDAATIVIEGGERYGLASLHQLRGRVGRDGNNAFCFVFMSGYSAKAYSRLKNLEAINDGLRLAEIDMKMRGQGDVFSTMQHGFKRFKIASLDNFSLIEQAKHAAEQVFGELDKYPLLTKKIKKTGEKIKNN